MSRIPVLKTYKLFIGGKFPRTESGRYYEPVGADGQSLGNLCRSSRKDFRNAVVAARAAFGGWNSRTAYNRGQILYRIAEVLEGRKAQFEAELVAQGSKAQAARKEVDRTVDRLVYYAGWCDKFQQVFSAVNPVASSHFNFSIQEPTGVVAIVAPENTSLVGLISVLAPVLAGANTAIVLASESKPLCAITLAEVLQASDVPGGVVNLLTGFEKELLPHMASHMDVNAVIYARESAEHIQALKTGAADNVKRVVVLPNRDWMAEDAQDPYLIGKTQEVKTTWHPIEKVGGSGSGY